MRPSETLCLLVGSPRSGTTLATRLLLEIEGVAGPPLETHFFQFVTPLLAEIGGFEFAVNTWEPILRHYAECAFLVGVQLDTHAIIREFDGSSAVTPTRVFRAIVRALTPGPASTLLEKTPHHLWSWVLFADDPTVKFVALVRDPRAVVESALRQSWGANDAAGAACWWLEEQRELRRMRAALGDARVLSFRYEDVVADAAAFQVSAAQFLAAPALATLSVRPVGCDSLFPTWESDWKREAAGPIDSTRTDMWLDRLDAVTVRLIESHCHREMRAHGYECLTQFRFTNPFIRWAGTHQARFEGAGLRLEALSVSRSDRRSIRALLLRLRMKVSQQATVILYDAAQRAPAFRQHVRRVVDRALGDRAGCSERPIGGVGARRVGKP